MNGVYVIQLGYARTNESWHVPHCFVDCEPIWLRSIFCALFSNIVQSSLPLPVTFYLFRQPSKHHGNQAHQLYLNKQFSVLLDSLEKLFTKFLSNVHITYVTSTHEPTIAIDTSTKDLLFVFYATIKTKNQVPYVRSHSRCVLRKIHV